MEKDNNENINNNVEKSEDTEKKINNKLAIKIVVGLLILIIYTIIVIILTARFCVIYINNSREANNNISSQVNVENKVEEQNNSDITITEQNQEENINNVATIKLNDKVTKESKYEMTVVDYDFSKKVLPPNTSSFYTYYEAKEDGHQYLDIQIKYKNLDYTDIGADDVGSVSIKFDDKYEYNGFCIIEDTDRDFTYANITSIEPLTEGNLHYLIDVPDEVANGEESIVAYINIGSDKYELKIR